MASDLDQWLIIDDDNIVVRNSGSPEDRLKCYAHLSQTAGAWMLNGFGSLVLIERETGMQVGRVGPSKPFDWPAVEIGWALAREFTGKGYALEGPAAAMDFALLELGLLEVVHTIRPSNTASQRLATKLGSTNRGPIQLPPPFHGIPNDGWFQTRDEWIENRQKFSRGP